MSLSRLVEKSKDETEKGVVVSGSGKGFGTTAYSFRFHGPEEFLSEKKGRGITTSDTNPKILSPSSGQNRALRILQ